MPAEKKLTGSQVAAFFNAMADDDDRDLGQIFEMVRNLNPGGLLTLEGSLMTAYGMFGLEGVPAMKRLARMVSRFQPPSPDDLLAELKRAGIDVEVSEFVITPAMLEMDDDEFAETLGDRLWERIGKGKPRPDDFDEFVAGTMAPSIRKMLAEDMPEADIDREVAEFARRLAAMDTDEMFRG